MKGNFEEYFKKNWSNNLIHFIAAYINLILKLLSILKNNCFLFLL